MGDLVELVMEDRMTVIKEDTKEEVHPTPVFGPQLIITTAEDRRPTIDRANISRYAPDGANAFVLGANHIRQDPIPDPFHVSDKQRYGYMLYQSIQYYKI